MLELLEAAVKAKLNIIIAGGTGAGKTTLLNALSAFINQENASSRSKTRPSFQLKQPHVAPGNPASEPGGTRAVRQRELLINSLRMRP